MRHLTVPRPALLSLATVAAVTLGAGVLAPIAQAGAPAAPPDVNPIVGGARPPRAGGPWPSRSR